MLRLNCPLGPVAKHESGLFTFVLGVVNICVPVPAQVDVKQSSALTITPWPAVGEKDIDWAVTPVAPEPVPDD